MDQESGRIKLFADELTDQNSGVFKTHAYGQMYEAKIKIHAYELMMD